MKKTYNRHTQYNIPFLCIVMLCIAGVLNICKDNIGIAAAEFIASIFIIVYMVSSSKTRSREMAEFMSIITEKSGNMANEVLSRFPLPMVVLSIDGKIVWFNEMVSQMLSQNALYDVSLPELIPALKWTEILKSTDSINFNIEYNGRYYNVLGNIIKRKEENENEQYSVLLYFDDKTEELNAQKLHMDEKVDVAIISIDNYDDVFQSMDDNKSQETIGKINSVISKWVAEGKGVMKKTDSDRYLVFFEHQYLENYIKTKFDILENIRAIGDEIKEPITISIGIGTGDHLIENESYARNAVEMVWGRGGDQAAIKEHGQFKFYGGTAKDYEKSTRVKTRMFAKTLREVITHADKVFFMGHSAADYDCFGASIGMMSACRLLNTNSFIILDNSPAVKPMYDEMMKMPEYQNVVISPNAAEEIITKDSVLIVLDTHRPSMLPEKNLLNIASKIVLIDHHRRSTEFIDNLSLSYLEPYASSTCEMVTEILQYIDDRKKMSAFEAKALYMGILMDTKNFVTKTGVRTFEAASYLKRYGVNTMEVKRLFNLSYDDYIKRLEIVKKTEIWNSDIAVSVCKDGFNNMRVISSQAADEMLNISGIKAAFVIYPGETGACLSARSFGDINVQIIMEKLGGGGHMTVAGCQLKNVSVTEARERLKDTIKEYIEENKK
ncbi:MAG: DHH family phosphoesterase [Clostridia bacterium]|nr:DHH family phosphoesterase [Clostridia bacterium]